MNDEARERGQENYGTRNKKKFCSEQKIATAAAGTV
jgi:hypothetical protein